MRRVMRLMMLGSVLLLALPGCGTLRPESVDGLRRVVGTDLIGAKGKTAEDQNRIDTTVVGMCGGGVYTPSECAKHEEKTRGEDTGKKAGPR